MLGINLIAQWKVSVTRIVYTEIIIYRPDARGTHSCTISESPHIKYKHCF